MHTEVTSRHTRSSRSLSSPTRPQQSIPAHFRVYLFLLFSTLCLTYKVSGEVGDVIQWPLESGRRDTAQVSSGWRLPPKAQPLSLCADPLFLWPEGHVSPGWFLVTCCPSPWIAGNSDSVNSNNNNNCNIDHTTTFQAAHILSSSYRPGNYEQWNF